MIMRVLVFEVRLRPRKWPPQSSGMHVYIYIYIHMCIPISIDIFMYICIKRLGFGDVTPILETQTKENAL